MSGQDVDQEEVDRSRLGRLLIRGTGLPKNISEAVTEASLSWATDAITQLSLSLADPGFAIWKTALFEKGTQLRYREPGMKELRLRISALELDGGPAGTGGFRVAARSEAVWKLRRRRGALVMKKRSPSQFVQAECKAVGVNAVVQPTAKRARVARDVPAKGQPTPRGASRPSSWTTFQRLASEVGFVMFEHADTVYFAQPTWLVEHDLAPMRIALPLPGQPERLVARNIPSISDSEDADVAVEITGLEVETDRIAEAVPGGGVKLLGLPPYTDTYLLTSAELPLIGTGGLTLTVSTPKNPEKQPPAKPGGSSDGVDLTTSGTKSALDFVTVALTASNAAYVFGAEASASDATPAALDCSELVQWALGRVGVAFVDGSASQIAACKEIPVATALKTRGALLYKVGHIGISLGDGRSVEARNPSDGVGVFRAADIAWTHGGLVPALKYR